MVLLATLRCEHRWHKAWWLVPCLSQETLLVLQASHKRGQENSIQATILDRRTNDQASFKSQGTEFLRLPFAPLRFPTKDIACLSSLRETSSQDWSGTDERLRLSVAVRCDVARQSQILLYMRHERLRRRCRLSPLWYASKGTPSPFVSRVWNVFASSCNISS